MPGPHIFDRQLLRARQVRARAQGAVTFLLDRVADDLADRIAPVLRSFQLAADIGTPSEAVRNVLAASGKIETVVTVSAATQAEGRVHIAADEEALPFADGSLDLAVSALSLHAINDLPGTLIQIRRALRPDGLFVAALLCGDTLSELREAFASAEAEIEGGLSPRVAPFADLRELGGLMQRAGFALPVIDSDKLVVRYESVFALLRDLRGMGATNVMIERRRAPLKRATLMRMAEVYQERFADPDGRMRATFAIGWLTGWAPHESQQKPLRPGSAKASLEAAVKGKKRD